MIIKTQLSEKDFIKVNFILLFRRPMIRIIYSFYFLFIILAAFTDLREDYSDILTPLIILLIIPSLTLITAKKNYASNPRIKETIEYKFENDNLIIEGESFKTQMSWDKIYKVVQTKNWVLIYQNRYVANIISKTDIWEGERAELKELLNQHHVKNNL